MAFIIVDDGDITYFNPLGPEKSAAIESLVRGAECFVPAFSETDCYQIETYIWQRAIRHTETRLLFDRNIYSSILTLAEGAPVNEETKYAAAIMAFAQCAHINIEPSLAIYEGLASGARGGWRRKLRLFRAVDKISPVNWAALALGFYQRFERRPSLPTLAREAKGFNPKLRLRPYWNLYPCVLKIASLNRSTISGAERLMKFLEWSYFDWNFSVEAILLAAVLFSKFPQRTPLSRTRNKNRTVALKDVRNATWDLVYLHQWYDYAKLQSESQELTLFCSRDAALLNLARHLRDLLFSEAVTQVVQLKRLGYDQSVLDRFEEFGCHLGDSERSARTHRHDPTYRSLLISGLEKTLLED